MIVATALEHIIVRVRPVIIGFKAAISAFAMNAIGIVRPFSSGMGSINEDAKK